MKQNFIFNLLLIFVFISSICSDQSQQARKQEFLKKYGQDYGYNGKIDELRAKEFARFENQTYLDYTAAGQYQISQLEHYFEKLKSQIYNNPHSLNPSAQQTNDEIEEVRRLILQQFNADPDQYSVIFTSGATGALKLIGEIFPFENQSEFWYTQENHNSVIGLRQLHPTKKFQSLNQSEIQERIQNSEQYDETINETAYHLFAFPGEENFSGKKYPLEWINEFQNKTKWKKANWLVLLDSAAYLPTNRLDLTKYPADFAVMSFYKIFGFPTGLGALVASNKYLAKFAKQKRYFGGGTVVTATSKCDWFLRPDNPIACLEDGTIAFNVISSVKLGFQKINELGIDNINKHLQGITKYLATELNNLQHSNGKHVVEVYGNHFTDPENQGGIVTFSILDKFGSVFGYNVIQDDATLENIHIRVGSACNPGACYASCKLPEEKIIQFGKYRESCGDSLDIIDDRPTGGIRASLGYPSTFEDVDNLVQFIKAKYVDAKAPEKKKKKDRAAEEKLKQMFSDDL